MTRKPNIFVLLILGLLLSIATGMEVPLVDSVQAETNSLNLNDGLLEVGYFIVKPNEAGFFVGLPLVNSEVGIIPQFDFPPPIKSKYP